MKYVIVLLATFMLLGVAYAGELEDTKAEYQKVVNAFSANAHTQNLMVEGFKSTNLTYQALVREQVKLQEMAKKLAEKIKKLEVPPTPNLPVEPAETSEE
jgi:beta-galactosidase GanA